MWAVNLFFGRRLGLERSPRSGVLPAITIFISEHFRSAIDRDPAPTRPGPQNFWNALIRQKLRRPLVLKTTTIEKADASIFSVGVGASRSVLSVVHFECHERAGSFRNQQFGRGTKSSEILLDSRFALHPVTNGSLRAHSFV
jgi:hypothetical protein